MPNARYLRNVSLTHQETRIANLRIFFNGNCATFHGRAQSLHTSSAITNNVMQADSTVKQQQRSSGRTFL